MPMSSVAQSGIRQSPQRQNLACFGKDSSMHGDYHFWERVFQRKQGEFYISDRHGRV